jgi:hypothetical protein
MKQPSLKIGKFAEKKYTNINSLTGWFVLYEGSAIYAEQN